MYIYYSSRLGTVNHKLVRPQRVTVVGQFNSKTNEFEVAVAKCSKKDQFCRKTGRELAAQRLNKKSLYMSLKGEFFTNFNQKAFNDLARAVATQVLESNFKVEE